MRIKITNHFIIRLATFVFAITAVLVVLLINEFKENKYYSNALKNSVISSVETISASVDNISVLIEKGIYTSDKAMLSTIANEIFHNCALAKNALTALPLGNIKADLPNKFLSQAGNYAIYLSQQNSDKVTFSDEENKNLYDLLSFSKELKNDLWDLESKISLNNFSSDDLFQSSFFFTQSNSDFFSNFESLESQFTTYPKLIYDGPYSDHLLTEKSKYLSNLPTVTQDEARNIFSKFINKPEKIFEFMGEESSNMPSYLFEGENFYGGVTKNGGKICYFLKTENVVEENISIDDAVSLAYSFLQANQFDNFTKTYYEKLDNILTINFAEKIGNYKAYSRLIKVSVALDDGEIIGYDARSYLNNKKDLEIPEEKFTSVHAKNTISKNLKVKKISYALIPLKSGKEVFTYEFLCENNDETEILIYVNTQTLKQEDILILYNSNDTTLAF